MLPAQTVSGSSDQIGERLRQAREDAGLSVDEAVVRTRLPRSAIEALEAEDFSHFSSPVYAKSFLAQYSGFLNVEATEWLDALKPSAFLEGDPQLSLLNGRDNGPAEVAAPVGARGGWASVLGLLAVSGGIIFGAIKLFDFFDARFGVDLREQIPNDPTRNPQAAGMASPAGEDAALRQTPRAIIGR